MCYTCCMLAVKPLNQMLSNRSRKAAEAAQAAEETRAQAAADVAEGPTTQNATGVAGESAEAAATTVPDTATPVSVSQPPALVAGMAMPQASGEAIPLQPLPSTAPQPLPVLQQETPSDATQPKERKRLTKAKKEKKVTLSEIDTIIPSPPLPLSEQTTPASLQPRQSIHGSAESEQHAPHAGSQQQESQETGQQQQKTQQQKAQRAFRPISDREQRDQATLVQQQPALSRPPPQEPSPPETTRIVRVKELLAFTASQLRFPGFSRRPDGPATSPQGNDAETDGQIPTQTDPLLEPLTQQADSQRQRPKRLQRPLHTFDGSAGVGSSVDSSNTSDVQLLAPTPRRPVSMRFPFMASTSTGTYGSNSSADDGGDSVLRPPQSSESTVIRRRALPSHGRSLLFASTAANAGSSDSASVDTSGDFGPGRVDLDSGLLSDRELAGSTKGVKSARSTESPSIYYPARTSPYQPALAAVESRPSTNQVFVVSPEFAPDGGSHPLRARSEASASAMNPTNHLLVGIAKMPAYKAPAGGPS